MSLDVADLAEVSKLRVEITKLRRAQEISALTALFTEEAPDIFSGYGETVSGSALKQAIIGRVKKMLKEKP